MFLAFTEVEVHQPIGHSFNINTTPTLSYSLSLCHARMHANQFIIRDTYSRRLHIFIFLSIFFSPDD